MGIVEVKRFFLEKTMKKVAILVDGGFYRKLSKTVKGDLTPKERADELYNYCLRHLLDTSFSKGKDKKFDELYRIFYYDCPPIDKVVYNPLTKKNIDFSKNSSKKWADDFYQELSKKRKVALRMGELSDSGINFNLIPDTTKKLLNGKKEISQLTERDLRLNIQQKGVDMRIGLDIASLSFKHQVDKIVLIAGDSDFVPAAKLARREGIDFILDSLGRQIRPSLSLHIDGRQTCDNDYRNYNKKS